MVFILMYELVGDTLKVGYNMSILTVKQAVTICQQLVNLIFLHLTL